MYKSIEIPLWGPKQYTRPSRYCVTPRRSSFVLRYFYCTGIPGHDNIVVTYFRFCALGNGGPKNAVAKWRTPEVPGRRPTTRRTRMCIKNGRRPGRSAYH